MKTDLTIKVSDWPKPVEDRVLVAVEDEVKESPGGIALPETEDDETAPVVGVVLAIGPGKMADNGIRLPMQLKENQRVVISSLTGAKITVNDRDCFVIRENVALLVLE